jgi:tRNA nucleotidyltransferase (CCA-adding enzyme)
MYHWIEDKAFLSGMRTHCADIVNRLVQAINSEGTMRVKQHLVGSGAKNLIVQNGEDPIDLDYNLEIINSGEFNVKDCREIKSYIQKKFNEVLKKAGWSDCMDSTSALTTEKWHFKQGTQTEFSIDLGIVVVGNARWYRLIHEKTGRVQSDRYYWNEAPQSKGLDNRVEWIRKNDYWNEVRDTYLEKKNMYLQRNDYDHPSFIVYIETINEVYNKRHPGLRSDI